MNPVFFRFPEQSNNVPLGFSGYKVKYNLCLQVYYCKEDEVCLYKSLLFEVPFRQEVSETSQAEITLAFEVKPKTSTSSLPL